MLLIVMFNDNGADSLVIVDCCLLIVVCRLLFVVCLLLLFFVVDCRRHPRIHHCHHHILRNDLLCPIRSKFILLIGLAKKCMHRRRNTKLKHP